MTKAKKLLYIYGTFLVAGVLIGAIAMLIFGPNKIPNGVIIISIFGTVLALTGLSIMAFNSRKVKMSNEDVSGKEIVLCIGCHHLKKGEFVTGTLYLLADKLLFQSYGFNIYNHRLEINLRQISKIRFGLLPYGLNVQTIDGKCERFILWGRKAWKREIEKIIHTK